jgi:hypothetical protein
MREKKLMRVKIMQELKVAQLDIIYSEVEPDQQDGHRLSPSAPCG